MRHDWTYKRFDEVFDLQMGKTPDRKNLQFFEGDNVWVSIRDMVSKEIDDSNEHISDSAVTSTNIRKVKKGTVIMSFKLTVGKCAIAARDLYTNEAIMAFNLKEGFDIKPDFLYYYLLGYRWEGANKAVMGMTLNKATISQHKIGYPHSSIQLSIVAELNKINELIALKKSQLNDFDYLIQSIFYEMFGDPVENSKGWEVNPLGTIADFKNGINFSKGESGSCYKFLGVSDFQDNKTVSSSSLGDIHLTEDLSDDYMLKTGDIVFVRSNGSKELVGRNILMLVDEPTTFSGFCIRCRLTDKDFNSVYLSCLLKASSMRPIITNSGRGCNISNLNQKILSSLPIIHPSRDLQDSFALYVSAIENQKSQLKRIILDLETLLAARLQYWFN